ARHSSFTSTGRPSRPRPCQSRNRRADRGCSFLGEGNISAVRRRSLAGGRQSPWRDLPDSNTVPQKADGIAVNRELDLDPERVTPAPPIASWSGRRLPPAPRALEALEARGVLAHTVRCL